MSKHKHNFKSNGYSASEIYFSCRCGETTSRKTTSKERKEIKKSISAMFRPKKEHNVHYVWHKFLKEFYSDTRIWNDEKLRRAFLFRETNKWLKNYPDYFRSVSCDDNAHAGARLILIEHKSESGEYMGTTCLFVSQYATTSEFFMYPDELNDMIKALRGLRKMALPMIRERRRLEREAAKQPDRFKL